jgi:hypothetical protein
VVLQQGAQVTALEVFHDDVRSAGIQASDVENACHVLGTNVRCRARFEQHATDDLVPFREVRANEFDRDGAIEIEMDGIEHDAHAAFADYAFYAVFTADEIALPHSGKREGNS